ncbi:hypothetical protein EV426DRAFT_620404 [Tirmania nivea]|nr:hypothetical protein EV426DRAFT_620404 [Tirmania nivea]
MPCVAGNRYKHCLTSTVSSTVFVHIFVLGYVRIQERTLTIYVHSLVHIYHCLMSTVFVLGYVRIQERTLTIYVHSLLLMSVPAAATSIASCL